MSEQLKTAIVRIFHNHGEDIPVGVGFLVSNKYILTCAHVVTQALDLRDGSRRPDTAISLDFPLVASGSMLSAYVIDWHPDDSEDIALLELEGPPPNGVHSARLVVTHDFWG